MPADYIQTDTYWSQGFPWWVNSNFPYWPILAVLVTAEVAKLLIDDMATLFLTLTDGATLDVEVSSRATLEVIVGDDP